MDSNTSTNVSTCAVSGLEEKNAQGFVTVEHSTNALFVQIHTLVQEMTKNKVDEFLNAQKYIILEVIANVFWGKSFMFASN